MAATLSFNGVDWPIIVDNDGSFSVTKTLEEGTNTIRVRATDAYGNTGISNTVIAYLDTSKPTVVINTPPSGFVTNVALQPVSGTITHSQQITNVTLTHNASLSLYVTDLIGHQVFKQNRGEVSSGIHSFYLDGSSIRPGIYFYTIVINGERFTKKMIVE